MEGVVGLLMGMMVLFMFIKLFKSFGIVGGDVVVSCFMGMLEEVLVLDEGDVLLMIWDGDFEYFVLVVLVNFLLSVLGVVLMWLMNEFGGLW